MSEGINAIVRGIGNVVGGLLAFFIITYLVLSPIAYIGAIAGIMAVVPSCQPSSPAYKEGYKKAVMDVQEGNHLMWVKVQSTEWKRNTEAPESGAK